MTNPSSGRPKEFEPMLAAYKLRLAIRAQELGQKSAGTWGKERPISSVAEQRLLAGEGDFRLSPFPYPGLRSFDPKEGKLFFGRETSIAEVRRHLAISGIVTVLGGSGSGKSSLVRAGLLPYLNSKRRIPGRVGSWYVAEFRPRTNPLQELADALADQVMLPLLDLEAPGLAEAMGLSSGERGEAARPKLRGMLRRRFESAQAVGRDAVRNILLDFVDRDMDNYDRLASGGIRVPGASLMLLVDQFEEAFRPEIGENQRKALLNLIVDLDARIGNRNEKDERTYKGGLFVAVTMRSEELHRCAEHRGLSEVINRSLYLLELLDPDNKEDAKELHKAIVQPARDVLDDWGIAYDRDRCDAPFAEGMPRWLLSGTGRRLLHQPDHLPLLQHALQSTWHAAMRRWGKDDFSESRLEIRLEDLPGQGAPVLHVPPDLGKCLSVRADKAAERAKEQLVEKAAISTEIGEAVLQASFRALAQSDDRGNWARRFADIKDINGFLSADPNSLVARTPKEAVHDVLKIFVLRGYLSGGNGSPYDISHEALIRNWPRFQGWLRELESAARALERAAHEIDPRIRMTDEPRRKFLDWLPQTISDRLAPLFTSPGLRPEQRQKLLDWIPKSISDQLAPVLGSRPTLPRSWAIQHLEPMLERSALKERWKVLAPNVDRRQLALAVLKEIDEDRLEADRERGREVSRRRRLRFVSFLVPLAPLALLIAVVIWVVFQKSIAALMAAHAQALIGAAISDHGAQSPPDRRARIILSATPYSDAASKLEVRWLSSYLAGGVLNDIVQFWTGERLPILTSEEMQRRARSDFDITSRFVLGRSSVIIKSEANSFEERTAKCLIVRNSDQGGAGSQGHAEWQTLPVQLAGRRNLQPAFTVMDGQSLKFGVTDESGQTRQADSDFQNTLPLLAQICLSSDATVLTLSSSGQGSPDLYDLQWTPCAPESDCQKKMDSDWRVRAVPIQIVAGADDLAQQIKSPCVRSIAGVAVPAESGRTYRTAGRIRITFTDEQERECPVMDRSVRGVSINAVGGPNMLGQRRPQQSIAIGQPDVFMMEFYTELAVPRTVEISGSVKTLLTECKKNTSRVDGVDVCKPAYSINVGVADGVDKFNAPIRNNARIEIRKRPQEDEILEINVLDEDLQQFAAQKVSLPAHHIDRAGITTSGEVLLHDDSTGVTWRFVAARSALEARIRDRGNCSGLKKTDPQVLHDQEQLRQDFGELAKLNIDSVCVNVK